MDKPKNLGGRPLKFKSAEELEKKIKEYFETEKQPTLAGLAFHLGIDRHTLATYKPRGARFSAIIKYARDKVLSIYEQRLLYSDRPVGVIFALKNMGWTDRQEVNQNVTETPKPILETKDVPKNNSHKEATRPN